MSRFMNSKGLRLETKDLSSSHFFLSYCISYITLKNYSFFSFWGDFVAFGGLNFYLLCCLHNTFFIVIDNILVILIY